MNEFQQLRLLIEEIERCDDIEELREGKIGDMVKAGVATAAMCSAAGCAPSVGVTYTDAKPAEMVYAFQQEFDGCGTITVTRDKAFQGSGCAKSVYIDGELAARLEQGETVTLHLTPGEHVMSTLLDGKGLCGMARDGRETEREIDIEAGAEEHYRLTIGTNGNEGISRTANIKDRTLPGENKKKSRPLFLTKFPEGATPEQKLEMVDSAIAELRQRYLLDIYDDDVMLIELTRLSQMRKNVLAEIEQSQK